MLAHCHGQILNVAELATALGVAQATVRRYVDLLEHLFLVRQLRPWHENLRKRQVKRPKLYLRDPGVYHHLIGAGTRDALQTHPRIGASWEGFVIEKVIAEAAPDEVYLWATRNGAKLDQLLLTGGRRVGVAVKPVDAPRRIRSMAVAAGPAARRALRRVPGRRAVRHRRPDHRAAGVGTVPGVRCGPNYFGHRLIGTGRTRGHA